MDVKASHRLQFQTQQQQLAKLLSKIAQVQAYCILANLFQLLKQEHLLDVWQSLLLQQKIKLHQLVTMHF